uniref:Polymerase/histidinol phosphatase N-terminal domain-containing protein n=1 Tax=Phytophthora ramorum TaxID=164328 RepID=H3GM84_PHYRM
MVSASAGHRKKKKAKKSKRKPVNLQANFNPPNAAYEALSDAMFPSNDHHSAHDEARDSPPAGDAACGDFHLHSVCSDGKLKPNEVIAKAAANGVKYMSLTDHDTMAGVSEAIAAAQKLGVLVFPGVEISAEVKGGENLHILGYFCPGLNSAELEKQLLKIRTGRHKRGKGMLKKLEDMGIKLKWERVLEIAGEAAPGRPHVAEALVEAGHVANFRQAFSRYLHNDGPAYVEGEHFPPEEAIKLIASAGGVSVLAHPWCCKNPLTLVPDLAKLGIQMGGSDFHGIDPTTERAPGAIPFPRLHVERFLAHALDVWERPLVERLRAMTETIKQSGTNASVSEELLIWKEQELLVRRTLAELGMGMEVFETEATQSEGSSSGVESGNTSAVESHYRTIRVTTLGR